MSLLPIALFALLQTPPAQAPLPGNLVPTPVARILVRPASRSITAGDSVRFTAQAIDSAGKPIANAIIRFQPLGGEGQGSINDSTGMLVGSSVGKMPINVAAFVAGARPKFERIEIHIVPGPAARIDLQTKVGKVVAGQQLRLAAIPFSAANDRAHDVVSWSSSAPAVARIDADGILTAIAAGRATIIATAGAAKTAVPVQVLSATISSVALAPNKPRARQGDVIRFTVTAKSAAGAAITDLTPTWTVSPGNAVIDADGSFVGYEPGDYFVTANLGARSVSTVVKLAERDVRRSVTVVGRLPRTAFPTSEIWIHPNGNVAYLGTHGGGDRVYTIDIANPEKPVIVDSIQANTRLVNDMMTTPDGNYMVFTRESAADRKNGIVIADTHDPLHPREIAHFTEGVTAGVHSAYVYKQEKYGTHVYLTNDGTGAIHVIDLADPRNPKQVAEFRTKRPDAARYVHDIDLHDGLLYASYWNDGLVILDVGNGIKGGRPDNPVLVSQFKYDLDSLYREVEQASAPGFDRGTHTAWRQRNGKYVFIGDEVYRSGGIPGAKDASANRMYGTLQVIDVSDIQHPKSVGWYKPEQGGVHNYWVVADTLYMGAYDGGFRVFDISGELKGDLRAQGREIASLNTADLQGAVPNAAFTWGVVVNPKDGLAYVNDFNNGLWVIRINPKPVQIVP